MEQNTAHVSGCMLLVISEGIFLKNLGLVNHPGLSCERKKHLASSPKGFGEGGGARTRLDRIIKVTTQVVAECESMYRALL